MSTTAGLGWNEPNSIWHRKLRRSYRISWAAVLWLTLISSGGLIFIGRLLLSDAEPGDGWFTWGALLCLAATFAAPIAMLARLLMQEHRALRNVPSCGADVCPRCIRPAAADGETLTCDRCDLRLTRSRVHAYWNDFPHDRGGAMGAMGDEAPRVWTARTRRLWRAADAPHEPAPASARRRWRRAALTMAAGSAVILLVFLSGAEWTAVSFFPVVIAAGLLVGLKGPTPTSTAMRCAGCGYERGDHATERCPECNADWREPGGLTTARQFDGRARRRSLAAFAAVMAFAFAPLILTIVGPGVMPTWYLTREMRQNSLNAWQVWSELETRSLDLNQQLALSEALLDARREAYLRHGEDWLADTIQSPAIPAELRERFYDEMITSIEVLPDTAAVGQPVTIRIRYIERNSDYPDDAMFLLVERITMGDSTTAPFWKKPRLASSHTIEPPITKTVGVYERLPRGSHDCSIAVWLIYGPEDVLDQEIAYDDNGAPILPDDVIWSKRIELEHTITIE